MNIKQNNNEKRPDNHSSFESMLVRNRDADIYKGNNSKKQYYNKNINSFNSKQFQDQANKDYIPFYNSYDKFLKFTDIDFGSCWKKGINILNSHASNEIKNKAGWLLLCLLNYSPENYEGYENDIDFIMQHVSIDVCTWYFFEISKYFFQFFSKVTLDKSDQSNEIKEAKKRLELVWKCGNLLLNSKDVLKQTVKSDVAEQLLLILDASDPKLIEEMGIDVIKEINEISKYIIHDDIETIKMSEYGFSFRKESADSKIRSTVIQDDSQEIIEKCFIKSLSVRHSFKMFNLGNLLSGFLFVLAVVLMIGL